MAEYRLSQQLTTGYFDNKLSSIATRERVASFQNFVPFDLETTITVEGWCLQNFISVAKLHLFHTEINENITVVMEAAWPSGQGARFVSRRSRVQILLAATRWICVWWSQIELLHALLIANWSASCQLGFLASFCLIYSIVSLLKCPQFVQQC